MSCPFPQVSNPPTLAGFIQFIQNQAQIPSVALPPNDIQITYAFNVAVDLVLYDLAVVSPTIYMLAVYNLGVSNLITWAIDQPGQTYFTDLRKDLNINGFVAGVISSSADETTSESLMVPDVMKNLTFMNLQNLKDPFGRAYLGLVGDWGPIWGIS